MHFQSHRLCFDGSGDSEARMQSKLCACLGNFEIQARDDILAAESAQVNITQPVEGDNDRSEPLAQKISFAVSLGRSDPSENPNIGGCRSVQMNFHDFGIVERRPETEPSDDFGISGDRFQQRDYSGISPSFVRNGQTCE